MSRFAISDIHGCLKSFKALLKQIDFSKEDELFLLGDYIDRGPDSKGVIDHIWFLQREGYTIKCLKGNHEEMMLDAFFSSEKQSFWLKNGGWNTMASFGGVSTSDIPQEYTQWLKNLPCYLETPEYILVHAGLNFEKENPLNDEVAMLWIRNWYHKIDEDWLGNRKIIHGHTPTIRPQIQKQLEHINQHTVLDIDCGCVYDRAGLGYLIAFNLDEKKLHFCPNVDR